MPRLPRLLSLAAAVAAVGIVATANLAPAAAVQNSAVGTQSRDIVYNAAVLKPFVDAAQTRRVDIAGIGDSNQVAGPGGNYGWDHGYSKAWTDRYGSFATGLFGTNAHGGWDGPQGYIDSWGRPYGARQHRRHRRARQVQALLRQPERRLQRLPPELRVLRPQLRRADESLGADDHDAQGRAGLGAEPQVAPDLRDVRHRRRRVQPVGQRAVRQDRLRPRVSTSTGTVGLADGAYSIPAAAYNQPGAEWMNIGVSHVAEGTMRGPFYGLWQRVEGDRPTGVSYSTTLWQGGRALVHAATALKAQSDDALKEYVRNLVKLQDGQKMLLVQVNHGGNDAGMALPSVGPRSAPSNTPAGFADNADALHHAPARDLDRDGE